MATNGFKQICAASEGILSQEAYEALPDLVSGLPTGILPRSKLNKVLKQASTIAAAIGEVVVRGGFDAADTDTPSALADNIVAALAAALPSSSGGVVPSVATVAALRNLDANAPGQVLVLGYYASSDGGGGLYTRDASDVTSSDNGGSVLVDIDGGRWKLSHTGAVSVRQFGARGNGASDDSMPFTNALASLRNVYVPPGTYRVAVNVDSPFRLTGAGSQLSVLRPRSTTEACITYRAGSPFWTYHSVIEGIGFHGLAPRSALGGYGVSFGATLSTSYVPGLEYANNVTFKNCRFSELYKAVHFPFGNIGNEFYACGWTANYYGVYSTDNKYYQTTANPAANLMHAGNKYFFGGQMDANVCAVYVHNTATGFGGLVFDATILEYNDIACYVSTTNTAGTPVVFKDVWNEGNGQAAGYSGSASIDAWSWSPDGPVRSAVSVTSRSIILEAPALPGAALRAEQRGGFMTDVWLRGPMVVLTASNVRHESSSGFGGRDCTVDMPDTSVIAVYGVETAGGVSTSPGVVVKSGLAPTVLSITEYSFGRSRAALVPPRQSKSSVTGLGGNFLALPLTGSTPHTGSVSATVSVVSDGRIYATCNQVSAEFTAANQLVSMGASSVTVPVGKWCVATVDFKLVSGDVSLCYWDASTARLFAYARPPLGRWATIGAIGHHLSGVSASMYFSVSAESASSAVWRVSALQIAMFDSRDDAESFLNSAVFLNS